MLKVIQSMLTGLMPVPWTSTQANPAFLSNSMGLRYATRQGDSMAAGPVTFFNAFREKLSNVLINL
jgi:hypothetical protein